MERVVLNAYRKECGLSPNIGESFAIIPPRRGDPPEVRARTPLRAIPAALEAACTECPPYPKQKTIAARGLALNLL